MSLLCPGWRRGATGVTHPNGQDSVFFLLLRYHTQVVGGDLKKAAGRFARIVTGCGALDEFTAAFRELCGESSIFLPMDAPLAVEKNVPFAIALSNDAEGNPGNVVLRGTGSISESFADAKNPYQRSGMLLELGRLDGMGRILLRELNAATVPKPDFGANASGDSDESFDVSTLVENPSLEELQAEQAAKEAGRKAAAFGGPGAKELARLVRCEVFLLDAKEQAVPAVGANPIANDDDDEAETTQVADVSDVDESSAEKTGVPALQASIAASPLDTDEPEETTTVSAGPDLAAALDAIADSVEDDDEEDRGAPTRVASMTLPGAAIALPVTQSPPIARIQPVSRVVPLVGKPSSGPAPAPAAKEIPRQVASVEAETAVPPQVAPPSPSTSPPMVAPPRGPFPSTHPPMVAPPRGPFPSTSPPMVAPPRVPPSSAAPPVAAPLMAAPPVAAPPVPARQAAPAVDPSRTEDESSEQTAVSSIPTPVPSEALPVQAQRPTLAPRPEQAADAIAAAIAETVVEPTVASRPLPGMPPVSPPAAARSISSLPMVSPVLGGGTTQPSAPVMIRRSTGAILGIACLTVGLGFGFLLRGNGASDTPKATRAEAKIAENDAFESGTRPVIVPQPSIDATPPSYDAEPIVFDASPPADAAHEVPDSAPEVPASDCEVLLDVTPVDATVVIAGTSVALGESLVAVPCGPLAVTIEHAKFASHKLEIETVAGTPFTLLHHMKSDIVVLRILSTPRKSWVQINGEGAGKTPVRRKVPAHEPIEIRVSKAGFKPVVRKVTPTEDLELDVQLRRFGKRRKRGR